MCVCDTAFPNRLACKGERQKVCDFFAMRAMLKMSKDLKSFLMWPQCLKSNCCSQSTMTLRTLSVSPLALFLFGTIFHRISHFATQLLIVLFYKKTFIKAVSCGEMD